MPFGKYMVAANLGTIIWIVSLMLAGYFFGEIPFVSHHMASIVLSGLAIGIACIMIGAAFSKNKPAVTTQGAGFIIVKCSCSISATTSGESLVCHASIFSLSCAIEVAPIMVLVTNQRW